MKPEDLDAIEAIPVPVEHQCAKCYAVATLRCEECGYMVCAGHADHEHGGRWGNIENVSTALVAVCRALRERDLRIAVLEAHAEHDATAIAQNATDLRDTRAQVAALTAERDAAFTRGVEAMREACADLCDARAVDVGSNALQLSLIHI
jgi:hypothetical protein